VSKIARKIISGSLICGMWGLTIKKVISPHAMKALGERSIAPTHS
jgi:hypothetical protein